MYGIGELNQKEKTIKKKLMVCVLSSIILSGCATTKESIFTGMSAGAALGAGTGALSNKKDKGKGAATGALIGAMVGGIASYIIHGSLQKRDADTRKETLLNLDKFSVSTPSTGGGVQDFKLASPDVEKECFDWEIKGSKLVQQHCVWTVKGQSFWTPTK